MPGRLDAGLRTHLPTLAVTAVAVIVCWLGEVWLGDTIVLVVMPAAVALAVWLGGVRTAVFSAAAGYLACDLLFIGDAGTIGPHDARTGAELAAFVVCSMIVITLGEALWRSRAREQHSRGIDAEERHRAEEARASLTALIDTSDDAIVSKSLEGIVRSWNRGAERLFGYSASEAVGKPINRIIPPELQDEERSILARLRRGERVKHFETVRLTKEGRRINVSLSVSPIRNHSGQIIGASKIARDITDQKRAEAALRFSEERFRELANNIDQFAWTCDELGFANWYNQRWYEYTGATVEQMRSDGWEAFTPPDHRERVQAGLEAALATGEPWEDTFPLRGRDGNYRWFLSRAVPIHNDRGDVIRWFGTNTDVTEQLKLEQELKVADRRKDEFIATLAHELRNPLAPMRNALEILNLAGNDAHLIGEAKTIVDRQMAHLVRLVDDLLDVSRITRDRLELRKTAVELNAIVEETAAGQRPQIEEQGQFLEVIPAPQPVHLAADPVRVAQILTNLLSNAIRYTPGGGRITVSVERQGRQVALKVADTGAGIPPDKLDHVFDMFAQVEETRSAHGGLGIGLTLVKRLAELHGGSVEGHSAGLAQGSEFVVRLPVGQPAALEDPEPEDIPCPQTRQRRVLVVEDNPDTASTLATLLGMAGHETRVAHDGPEAIDLAGDFRPEVVLLDLGLPKLNGVEVCRWIRRQPWGGEVVVAALTGWGQEADRRRTEEAGFDRHLVKPVGPDTVLGLLAEAP